MLVAYPIVFYTSAFVCYSVYNSNREVFRFKVAVVATIAGAVMAAVAAIPGFIDWLFIPKRTGAKRTGVFHLLCNVGALLCFAIAGFMEYKKWSEPDPSLDMAIPLTGAGLLLTIIAGFLGFTLIQKHHVGVDEHAKL